MKEEIYDDILKADSWKKLHSYVAVIEEVGGAKTGGAGKTAGPNKTSAPASKKKVQAKSTKRKLCK